MKRILNKNIMRASIRGNWKLWMTLTVTLCVFITLMTIVVNSNMNGDEAPGGGGMMSSGGMEVLYGFMFFGAAGMGGMLMMIYSITVGNRLVAGEVDRGNMSFTLNTPITRRELIFSKALFFITSIVGMMVLLAIVGMIVSLAIGATINLGDMWVLVLGSVLFAFATSSIAFFASCWFNKTGHSIMVGAGVPVAFMLFSMLSDVNELSFLRYFSMNTLFESIFDGFMLDVGSHLIAPFAAMFVIGVVLYAIGIRKFLTKDLPL